MSASERWLPWALLANAVLLALIADRYVTLRDTWRVHDMAVERADQLLGSSPR